MRGRRPGGRRPGPAKRARSRAARQSHPSVGQVGRGWRRGGGPARRSRWRRAGRRRRAHLDVAERRQHVDAVLPPPVSTCWSAGRRGPFRPTWITDTGTPDVVRVDAEGAVAASGGQTTTPSPGPTSAWCTAPGANSSRVSAGLVVVLAWSAQPGRGGGGPARRLPHSVTRSAPWYWSLQPRATRGDLGETKVPGG